MRNLKRLWSILMAMAVVFPFLAYGQSDSYYDRSYARMSFVQGDVFVQRAQNQGYEKGEINLVVVQGDKLGSRSGRLEIQLGQRNYLRLDNDTQIDLVNLPGHDGDPTKLHVLAGSVFLRIYSLDRPKNFEVHTPDGSFYVLTAGQYRIDVRENRETEFSVISGSAEAAGEEGSVSLEDGQRVVAANGRFTSEAGALQARRDDFASWNESREAVYARATTGRSYLPAQYADYETELADNGSWVDEPEYGSVWVPRGVYSDWRPYSNGRWVWYPILGWTWVSYDSWGWCTHHYGRWGWGNDLGWYWIPRDHWGWGPAWVNWWNDDYYVGWCPLSYWGYPAVIYNNRFYGRYGRGEYYNYSHFARTMTVVGRNQLWDRNIGRSALGGDRLLGRVDRISLGANQPNIRPSIGRNDGLSSRAASVLGRENLRSVGRGYGGNGTVGGGLAIRGRDTASGSTGRQIRSYSSSGSRDSALSSTRGVGGTGSSSTVRRYEGNSGVTTRDRSLSGSSSSGSRAIREYGGGGRSTSGAVSRSLSGRSGDSASSTMRSYPSRSSSSSRSLGNSGSSSSLREYGSRSTVGRSGGSSSGISSRSYSAPSRSYSAPSRSYSSGSSSRSYSAPSRSYSSGSSSRSYSAPSRSYSSGSSSRSYSAPSRSYSSGSSSRSYSAPSRSYSSGSSSRSYSAPSRSYSSGSSSRSYSAPSRSYSSGSSSRSSSGSSRSSSSSSGRSSGGSGHRR